MKFLADDGKVFDTIEACEDYESKLSIVKLNWRKFDMIYGDFFSGEHCIINFFDIKNWNDLMTIKGYYKNKIDELYSFESKELNRIISTHKKPFTAVVMEKDNKWVELLSLDKSEFINELQKFVQILKES